MTHVGFVGFMQELRAKYRVIFELSLNDFKKKYTKSVVGMLWSIIQPIVSIGVLWVVFSVGFRSSTVQDAPFIVWLICGLTPWYYFTDSLGASSNSIIEYRFILKHMSLKPELIPYIKLLSAIYQNIFFLLLTFALMLCYHIPLSFYNLQILYYFFCMHILLIGIGWLTSSIKVFINDVGDIINIVIQVGMWFTPILWDISLVSEKFLYLFKLNPMFYIVQGYRDSLIYHIPFYERMNHTIIFWFEVCFIVIFGMRVFTKLKPRFNDVL